ncbi:hypothetical protein fgpv_186 [Flamingopox virus FGPVKD09]|uniref:IMV membrane protein n=1 Tax=Flamingopox virus FGPVKD09 TaxID=2059380 RepID=A0A2H4X2H8_9POXV|nr:hypothetical protein C1178_gp186 [Flamingopox virus FGPVKD09]AUD40280.1 hypothetical protein fgpv_186 [Flamingopox virus FGPVKD09]
MSCYSSVLNTISGLAFLQVANNVIELVRHCIMHFCETRIRRNTLSSVILKILIAMVIYFMIGLGLFYLAKNGTETE